MHSNIYIYRERERERERERLPYISFLITSDCGPTGHTFVQSNSIAKRGLYCTSQPQHREDKVYRKELPLLAQKTDGVGQESAGVGVVIGASGEPTNRCDTEGTKQVFLDR